MMKMLFEDCLVEIIYFRFFPKMVCNFNYFWSFDCWLILAKQCTAVSKCLYLTSS